jgi:hypothetical protein
VQRTEKRIDQKIPPKPSTSSKITRKKAVSNDLGRLGQLLFWNSFVFGSPSAPRAISPSLKPTMKQSLRWIRRNRSVTSQFQSSSATVASAISRAVAALLLIANSVFFSEVLPQDTLPWASTLDLKIPKSRRKEGEVYQKCRVP